MRTRFRFLQEALDEPLVLQQQAQQTISAGRAAKGFWAVAGLGRRG